MRLLSGLCVAALTVSGTLHINAPSNCAIAGATSQETSSDSAGSVTATEVCIAPLPISNGGTASVPRNNIVPCSRHALRAIAALPSIRLPPHPLL